MTNPSLSLLLPDKPQLFSIITWQTIALLYYYLTSLSHSLLIPDKPKLFSNITWQTSALLYYYLANPRPFLLLPDKLSLSYYDLSNHSPSLLFPDKPKPFSIITWQTPALLYYYLTNPRPSLFLPDKPDWPIPLLKKCWTTPCVQFLKPSPVPSLGNTMHDVAWIKLSIQRPNNQSI
jgi:hypothetical protein